MTPHLLEVKDFSLGLLRPERPAEILAHVSFHMDAGEVVLLLGESGSGKTLLTRSLTKLFPPAHSFRFSGEILYREKRVLELTEEELRTIRRREIRYIFQEPVRALNPTARVGEQMRMAWDGRDRTGSRRLAPGSGADRGAWVAALARTGIPDPASVLHLFPHQLSMGMAQRVMLAMALLPEPALLIADEPTSSVDQALRDQILALLSAIQRGSGMAMLIVTHDLEVAEAVGDRVLVMHGGCIVEAGPKAEVLHSPLHPYTQMLVSAGPEPWTGGPAPALPEDFSGIHAAHGRADGQAGCTFAAHCVRAQDVCRTSVPEREDAAEGREVRCFFWK